jgi:hypothetical protein
MAARAATATATAMSNPVWGVAFYYYYYYLFFIAWVDPIPHHTRDLSTFYVTV